MSGCEGDKTKGWVDGMHKDLILNTTIEKKGRG